MKIHFAVKTLEKDLQIDHPYEPSGLFNIEKMTCKDALKFIAEMSLTKHWVENYQHFNEHF